MEAIPPPPRDPGPDPFAEGPVAEGPFGAGPDPVLAERFAQATVRDVLVPTDLAERILARLKAARPDGFAGVRDGRTADDRVAVETLVASALDPPFHREEASADGLPAAGASRPDASAVEVRAGDAGPTGRRRDRGLTRRRWLAGLLGGGTLAAGAGLGLWLARDRGPRHVTDLAGAAVDWTRRIGEAEMAFGPVDRWRATFPIDDGLALRPIAAARCEDVTGDWLAPAVAYRLVGPTGPATLFVGHPRVSVRALPVRVREEPVWSSEGFCVGAWFDRDLVSVLALRGSLAEYRRIVVPPAIT